MSERNLFIVQTDILGRTLYSTYPIPESVINKISSAIAQRPELIGIVFHDKESGNFYKVLYAV